MKKMSVASGFSYTILVPNAVDITKIQRKTRYTIKIVVATIFDGSLNANESQISLRMRSEASRVQKLPNKCDLKQNWINQFAQVGKSILAFLKLRVEGTQRLISNGGVTLE